MSKSTQGRVSVRTTVLWVAAFGVCCTVIFLVGTFFTGISLNGVNSAESAILGFALKAQIVRVMVCTAALTVGWSWLRRLSFSRSGLDIEPYRLKWAVFYYGAEAVIFSYVVAGGV